MPSHAGRHEAPLAPVRKAKPVEDDGLRRGRRGRQPPNANNSSCSARATRACASSEGNDWHAVLGRVHIS
jgi:hypothetical protein